MMSRDYITRLSGILPESEVISAFKNAYPENTFYSNVAPIVANVVALLRGDADEITTDLDIKGFRTGASTFFRNASKKAVKPEHKKLLEHFSYLLSSYPDTLISLFIVPRSEITSLEDLRGVLSQMATWTMILGGIGIVSLVFLLFNARALGIALLVSGSLGILSSLLIAIVFLPKTPANFFMAIVHEMTRHTILLLSLESVIIFLVGALLLWLRVPPSGGISKGGFTDRRGHEARA